MIRIDVNCMQGGYREGRHRANKYHLVPRVGIVPSTISKKSRDAKTVRRQAKKTIPVDVFLKRLLRNRRGSGYYSIAEWLREPSANAKRPDGHFVLDYRPYCPSLSILNFYDTIPITTTSVLISFLDRSCDFGIAFDAVSEFLG